MNRKKAILLLLVIVIAIVGYSIFNYYRSFKPVSIDVKRSGISVTILDTNDNKVGSLAGSGKLSLKAGKYSVIPGGTNISTKAIPLTVTSTGGYLTIDPGYSQTYLNQLLTSELPAIQSVLTTQYSGVINGFTPNKGSLYVYGDWYATTLVQNSPGPGANGDIYRTVLHKENGQWKVVATPAIVLSVLDYPTIPITILTDINAQSGY